MSNLSREIKLPDIEIERRCADTWCGKVEIVFEGYTPKNKIFVVYTNGEKSYGVNFDLDSDFNENLQRRFIAAAADYLKEKIEEHAK